MLFRLFTLHPDIFSGFVTNSLVARGVAQAVISFDRVNWREDFGIGNYKQVDDKPFGGGSGMVLMPQPISQAMQVKGCLDHLDYQANNQPLPNNSAFFEAITNGTLNTKKVNIMTTPRGFPLTQPTAQWLAANFDEMNILCGRYEGFDARINDQIDLELSVGNFVLNGGETAAMCLVEAVARLVPGFITKNTSVLHDSFSSGLNNYSEFAFSNGSTKYQQQFQNQTSANQQLFDNQFWLNNILPYIEHPQYTRPEIWNNQAVPEILLSGHHGNIQKWRKNWWK
jgi:tRNA (guanine37-N1)-methyltransferase